MSIWYAIPSARPLEEIEPVIKAWRERGYRVWLWRDPGPDREKLPGGVYVARGRYMGYAVTVNFLCRQIMAVDERAEWIVTGGDDVWPDPNKTAEEIGRECSEYFAGRGPATRVDDKTVSMSVEEFEKSRTFGVMQPTGDDWSDIHEGKKSRIIERIAGSPWMGREFCRRMNGGEGPLWPEYTHCFEDEELQLVAQKLGVFWQRPELTHRHDHWQRQPNAKDAPAHLAEATSKAHWDKFKALFEQRKAAGFPGSEPIE